jgi:formate hydrogenlyase subunit 4
MLTQFAIVFFQVTIILALAPLLSGIIKKVKAFLQMRKGPGIFQPYYDIAKLLRKDSVVSENVSWIFHAAPIISFVAVLTAGLIIPVYISNMPFSFAGDLIAVVYLFALARFFIALASLDAGSSFGGREQGDVHIIPCRACYDALDIRNSAQRGHDQPERHLRGGFINGS